MGVFDDLKTAAEVLRAADKVPEMMQILKAAQELLELQGHLEAEKKRCGELQAELDAIRSDQLKSDGITRTGDFYTLNGNRYCVYCWENEKRLGPLLRAQKRTSGSVHTFYQCGRCKQEVTPRGLI
jgi:hypothetical protein